MQILNFTHLECRVRKLYRRIFTFFLRQNYTRYGALKQTGIFFAQAVDKTEQKSSIKQ